MDENLQTTAEPVSQQPQQPHRGTLILVLGILGIVCCLICGIIAWVMGNGDLKEMDEGRMDSSGRGLTQAGKICGMISVIWQIVVFGIWLILVVVGAAGAVATAPRPM
jgi:hypothetical protein